MGRLLWISTLFVGICSVVVWLLLAQRTEVRLHFSLPIQGVSPAVAWSVSWNPERAMELQPLALFYRVTEGRATPGQEYYLAAEYRESLPYFGYNDGWVTMEMKEPVSFKGSFTPVYTIKANHTNCILWNAYCVDSRSEMRFSAGEHETTFVEEDVLVFCPSVLVSFCRETTRENRENWFLELQSYLQRVKESQGSA